MRAKTVKFERGKDPRISMGISGLEAKMLEYFENGDTYDLIHYRDELDIEEIRSNYRIEGAQYDDAHYKDMPLDELEKLGITWRVLDLIIENTPDYEGWINEYNGLISIGGGA